MSYPKFITDRIINEFEETGSIEEIRTLDAAAPEVKEIISQAEEVLTSAQSKKKGRPKKGDVNGSSNQTV